MFRMVVQDSRQTPTSGKVVAQLGHYDPHTKAVAIDKEKAATFLSNGAQPSPRVARLLKKEGVKLPDWVVLPGEDRARTTRNPEKLRKNQPKEEVSEAPAEEKAEDIAPVEDAPEAPSAEATDAPAEDAAETVAEEAPAEDADKPAA